MAGFIEDNVEVGGGRSLMVNDDKKRVLSKEAVNVSSDEHSTTFKSMNSEEETRVIHSDRASCDQNSPHTNDRGIEGMGASSLSGERESEDIANTSSLHTSKSTSEVNTKKRRSHENEVESSKQVETDSVTKPTSTPDRSPKPPKRNKKGKNAALYKEQLATEGSKSPTEGTASPAESATSPARDLTDKLGLQGTNHAIVKPKDFVFKGIEEKDEEWNRLINTIRSRSFNFSGKICAFEDPPCLALLYTNKTVGDLEIDGMLHKFGEGEWNGLQLNWKFVKRDPEKKVVDDSWWYYTC